MLDLTDCWPRSKFWSTRKLLVDLLHGPLLYRPSHRRVDELCSWIRWSSNCRLTSGQRVGGSRCLRPCARLAPVSTESPRKQPISERSWIAPLGRLTSKLVKSLSRKHASLR